MSFMTEMESKTEFSFLMHRIFVKTKHFPLLSTVNLPLAEFIHMLTAFYHLPVSLVLLTHSLADASEIAQVEINYTLN